MEFTSREECWIHFHMNSKLLGFQSLFIIGILKTREHNFLDTGSVSVLR
jgi:hypothetical protein